MRAKSSRGVGFLAALLIIVGAALLFNNFLLISGFNVSALLPLIFVLAGAIILVRGDLFAGSGGGRAFGITRGSVEAGTIEASAGEIDVIVSALEQEGRLIGGQYAAASRPALDVENAHARLRFDRAATPWLSFADWQIDLARDLPWTIYVTTHLGEARLDLAGVIIQRARIATGIGDIRVTCPREAFEPIELRSALGSIQWLTPPGSAARVRVRGGRRFGVQSDPARYEQVEPGVYLARDADPGRPLVEVTITGTFGDAFLA